MGPGWVTSLFCAKKSPVRSLTCAHIAVQNEKYEIYKDWQCKILILINQSYLHSKYTKHHQLYKN